MHGLEFLAAGNAAANFLDDFADGDAHWDFDQAGAGDFAGQSEYLCPLAFRRTIRRERRRTLSNDPGHKRKGLDVVHQGGPVPQAAVGGEGRSDPRDAAAAFDGFQQCGLFAADKRPGAFEDVQLEIFP